MTNMKIVLMFLVMSFIYADLKESNDNDKA